MLKFLFSCAALAFTITLLPAHASDAADKVTVVHFSRLTPLLGDVAGWEADKAQGKTVHAAQVNQTSVERNYRRGDSSVSLHITDYSESPEMLQTMTKAHALSAETNNTLARAGVSVDTTKGYQKVVIIDGVKAFEKYENAGKKGAVSGFVAGRYYVQVETQGLPASELQAWLKNIDLKKLAEVK